jgi:hypothetical protein
VDGDFQSIFSEKNVVSMLLFIYANKKVKESQLTEIVPNYYTSVKVVNILADAGLVRSWSEKVGYTIRWYEITDLGTQAAGHLYEANNLVKQQS